MNKLKSPKEIEETLFKSQLTDIQEDTLYRRIKYALESNAAHEVHYYKEPGKAEMHAFDGLISSERVVVSVDSYNNDMYKKLGNKNVAKYIKKKGYHIKSIPIDIEVIEELTPSNSSVVITPAHRVIYWD